MKLLHKIYSGISLSIGILMLILITPTLMLSVALPAALISLTKPKTKVGKYGFEVWIGFDKFFNAVFGGSHKETISSRLGKSVYFDHHPVFGLKYIDTVVAWMLDQVDESHCWKSIDWSVGRTEY